MGFGVSKGLRERSSQGFESFIWRLGKFDVHSVALRKPRYIRYYRSHLREIHLRASRVDGEPSPRVEAMEISFTDLKILIAPIISPFLL